MKQTQTTDSRQCRHNAAAGLLAALLMLVALIPVRGATTTFTYGYGNPTWAGTDKRENYDVAIRIAGPEFAGKQITAIEAMLPTSDISGVKLWLSSELKLTNVDGKRVNVADIFEAEATPAADGSTRLTLTSPYTIGEKGVYVGYSFESVSLTDATERPVAVVNTPISGGLYIHSSRTTRDWTDMSGEIGAVSTLKVALAGDIPASGVSVAAIEPLRVRPATPYELALTVANAGSVEVKSITVDYTVEGGTAGSAEVAFDQPMAPDFMRPRSITVPMEGLEDNGAHAVKLTVTKVNGEANGAVAHTAEGVVRVVTIVPVKRPLLEEYGGTWCPFCVRGIAAIERMTRLYPDDFIAVSYHQGDSMAVYPDKEWPDHPAGLPAAYIDRVEECDPYYGIDYETDFAIEALWRDYRMKETSVAIDVAARLEPDGTVAAEADYTFVEPTDAAWQMVWFLVADGLHGEGTGWDQQNAYHDGYQGQASWFVPEMRRFCEGPRKIEGLYFNDVLVKARNLSGKEDEVLDATVDLTSTLSAVFNPLEITNLDGNRLITDVAFTPLHVVAAIVDSATGRVTNAAKTEVKGSGTSVGEIEAAASAVTATEVYTLSGVRVGAGLSALPAGIYVVRQQRTDGTVISRKISVR